MSAARRGTFVVVLFVACTLAAMLAREIALGALAVAACNEALDRGDLAVAIDAARSAAEATAPGSPYPEQGYLRLEAIARAAETRGDDATAMTAWRAERSAAMATRTPLGPALGKRLDEAHLGIARVAAPPRGGATEAVESARRDMLGALARDDRPPPWALLLLGAGALTFFGGVVRMLLLPPGATPRAMLIRASVAAAGFGVALVVCLRG